MSERDPLAASLDALREAFDASFAVPPPGARADEVALLAIRVGDEPVAVRVHDTVGLLKAGSIVSVPSRRPELLGITGVRGAVVPVYSLARLMGRTEVGAPGWIALAGSGDRIGLAFAEFERHVRVSSRAIHAAAATHESGTTSAVVELDGETRPLVAVAAIVRAIATRTSDQKTG